LGGLHCRNRGFAQHRNKRKIAAPAQFTEIEVAELARQRAASPCSSPSRARSASKRASSVIGSPRVFQASQRLRRL
jgi:hypothetical protein